MFELLGVVVGLSLVAVAPRVPVLRNVAKAVVKGGIAVTGMTAGAVSTAGKPWANLMAQVQAERDQRSDSQAGAAAEATSGAPADQTFPGTADLTRIRGIGPKTASLLNEAGIQTLAQLAATDVDRLQEVLNEAGARYRAIDPASWPSQAEELIAAASQNAEE